MPDSPKPGGSKHGSASSSKTAATATTDFTPEMRDRQARGKNPYNSDSDDSDASPAQGDQGPRRIDAPKKDEPFAAGDRRRLAAQVLNSHELLMMAALRDDQSIPATRLKYTRMLCGLEDPAAARRSSSGGGGGGGGPATTKGRGGK
ncbi:hypothetical protein SAMD00023353_1601500 [Rosellinia necatrix]|uniref:Uncharacterized protein n=1 Tax=Rosellinia necatrix TaxID=77044 RepID=A0A1W2TI89_ROSNE|nr:hypothetical protein SAMD00023353_1601500 [Rosellinia necatrix]